MTLGWDAATAYGCPITQGGRRIHVDNNGAVGGQGGALGNVGKSAGKWYWEVQVISVDATASGMAIGVSDQHGVLRFLYGVAVGYNSGAYFINDTEAGDYASFGTLIVASSVLIAAGMRLGFKLNLDDGWMDIISLLSPEGTHQLVAGGGHDAYVFPHFLGHTVYPMVCTGFGNGADHSWDVDIFGDESEFLLPHDAAFKALSPRSSLLALL